MYVCMHLQLDRTELSQEKCLFYRENCQRTVINISSVLYIFHSRPNPLHNISLFTEMHTDFLMISLKIGIL